MTQPEPEPGRERNANRLVGEASPYLLQHAYNPVDWYPWGPEALARARAEDKPFLLSIGYAACHWCHVMERESFEDPETAALMNRDFVAVKVDREERPDLDAVYMTAVQAMTGQGGWPMTVFLTPEGAPFFAGTYFPKDDRVGLPSFRKVLVAIADAWRNRRDDVGKQAGQIVEHLAQAVGLPGRGDSDGGGDAGDGAGGALREGLLRQAFGGLLRELRHPDGGLWSSQDADSEGVEGKFFVWDYDELVAVGGEASAAWYAATPTGNWEGDGNVLWTPRSAEAVAASLGSSVEELEREVLSHRPELLRHRDSTRVHPATDDKVLAAWNGLAIQGLAEAGRAFGEPRYLDAAKAAASFVLEALQTSDGRLLRAWRDGRRGGPGYLDDYACMAAACLTLYECEFEPRWLEQAVRLADAMLALFADPAGGFFQTGADAERLVVRPREFFDNAVPAGSSVAAEVLLRLGHLTGEESYEGAALGTLRPLQELFVRAPTGFGYAMGAADLAIGPVREVAIIGVLGGSDTGALLAEARRGYRPNQVVALAAPGDSEAAERVPLLAGRPAVGGRATAYVCERFTCQQPVTEPEALAAQLA